MLLGARPAEAGERRELLAALTVDPATEVVTVGPLTTIGVATLVAAGLGVEPEPEFVQACWEATGGTPFLVRTLVEALREERIAPVPRRLEMFSGRSLPPTLARWAMLHLVQLGPDVARMARAVAVLERAELDQAAQLAGLALPDAARAADLLVQAGVLEDASTLFRATHSCAAPSIGTWQWPSGPRRTVGRQAAGRRTRQPGSGRRASLCHLPGRRRVGGRAATGGWPRGHGRGGHQSPRRHTCAGLWPSHPRRRRGRYLLLELGLSEFSASQSGWHEHLEDAVESARDDTIRIAATLLLANALWLPSATGGGSRGMRLCRRAPRRSRTPRAIGGWRPWRSPVGPLDAAVAPLVADRAAALLVGPAQRQSLRATRWRWPPTKRRWPTYRPTRWLIWPAEPSPPARGRCRVG